MLLDNQKIKDVKGKGIASVDGELVCETELIFAFGE